jgi:hypothetical protein
VKRQRISRPRLSAQASGHVAQETAHASAGLVERQLASAETNLAVARTALIRARDDEARQRAAQQVVTSATAERDALLRQLAAAQATKARVEGEAISAGSEFAAIAFISSATGSSPDAVARGAILTIAAVPDILAVLLLLATGHQVPKPVAPKRRKLRRRPAPPRRSPPALQVVPQHG